MTKSRRKVALRAIAPLATALVALAFAGTASANSAGQCNVRPGNSVTSVTEWSDVLRQEGVIREVSSRFFRPAGYAKVDQTVDQWMAQRVVRGRASKSFTAHDYGCRSGRVFDAGVRHYVRGKDVFYVLPKAYSRGDVSSTARKGWMKKSITVKVIGLIDCGNPVVGRMVVVIWTRPVLKTPKGPTTCVAGQTNPANSGAACQTTVQVNANCSKVTVSLSDGTTKVTYTDGSGNVVTESFCSTVVTNPTPVTPPADRPPTISNDGMTAHTMAGDNRQLWFVVTDPDGDNIDSFNVIGTSPYAHVAGIMSVTTLGSNQPCPAKSKCFTATLWADAVPPGMSTVQAQFTAIASANGREATPLPISLTIIPTIM